MAFLVGTAQTEITPVANVYLAGYNLYAKSIYIENNKEKVALVSLDLIGLSLNIVDKIRKAAKKDVNLDNVIITCTHTHSGPNTISSLNTKIDDNWFSLLPNKIIYKKKKTGKNRS